ncbi:MAG: hypothetical protein N2512_08035 [Armatimonadetes bacterium]|nr:hypothetical protein [Armatimonadota bacterium]
MRPSIAMAAVAGMLVGACALTAQPENPITNGGFEQVTPEGWAVDWQRVGTRVTLTQDAHTGRYAALLDRTPEAIENNWETGLNRDWQPHSGQQGAMLSQLKGGVRFWYKVPHAPPDAKLTFFMIPMSDDPLENTGGPREEFNVPADHFGDGQWHQGVLAYDFTANKRCKWVQVSPRVMTTRPAQWIIDDIEWVESVGPVANVVKMRLDEVRGREGQEANLTVHVKNAGDRSLAGTARLKLPEYLRCAEDPTQPFGPLAPGEIATLKWRLVGPRDREDFITVSVTGGALPVSSSLKIAPELDLMRLEMRQFVLWPGKETTVAVVASNKGTAAARNIRATIQLPPQLQAQGPTAASIAVVPPKGEARCEFRVRATKQTPGTSVQCLWQAEGEKQGQLAAEVIVGAPAPNPKRPPKDAACVACETFEIIFPRNDFGYGIGWVFTRPGGEPVGAIPGLARVATRQSGSDGARVFARTFERRSTATPLGATAAEAGQSVGVTFTADEKALQRIGLRGPLTVTFAAAPRSGVAGKTITWQVGMPAPQPGVLLALDGPMLCVGEGSFADEKDEALYPGLEWLEGREVSSSTLDISENHPHRYRYVAEPRMVTIPLMAVRKGRLTAGLLWHCLAKWNDGKDRPGLKPAESDTDRPCAVFASPDWVTLAGPDADKSAPRFGGHASHLMGLFVPSPPYVQPNQREAKEGWPAPGVGARNIRLTAAIYVNPDSSTAMDAMRAWFGIYGVAPPRDLPRGQARHADRGPAASEYRGDGLPAWAAAARRDGYWQEPTREEWINEIEWSSQGYLKTLWVPEAVGWMGSKNGPPGFTDISPNPNYLFDCVVAAKLTDDPALRRELEERIGLVLRTYPWVEPVAEDMGFFFGRPVSHLVGAGDIAASPMASQDPDGGWRFHPYVATTGIFKGMDYADLGYEGQEAVGLCARSAYLILRVARMTGDPTALEAGLKALRYMEKFMVPRAAQVWEVPVHTPDVLASADACEAYLEGYWATGDRRWLERAVYWLETGLPFLYQWDVDAFPWMRYASIPVFGATWYMGSWFGQPVQWNGLRWAYAAQKLAEVDNTYPWRMLAAGVVISAMYQQGTAEEELTLWPDNMSTLDGARCPWVFAPRMILQNVYKLMGYEPEPTTTQVKTDGGTLYINACGKVSGAQVEGDDLRFSLSAPEPLPTRVVICGLAEPATVTVGGAELPRRESLGSGPEVGWCYHGTYSMLEISPGRTGKMEIGVRPVAPRPTHLQAPVATALDFSFDTDDGGWRPANHLTDLRIQDGCLVMQATGSDPYMTRGNCKVEGSRVQRIHVRMAVSQGAGAEFYWTTTDSPHWAEDKTAKITIRADGEFHDYYFEVGDHPLWRDKTITAIRLDPMSGATAASIKIDFIRGEP